jgi:putative ABC transport system ATP-binding protein
VTAPANEVPVIRARRLCRTYTTGDTQVFALKDADVEVRRGEMVAIVGASGSGKTTLLAILGCLDQPSSGSYELEGQQVEKLDPTELAHVRNRSIGFVFQSFNLLERERADENAALPLRYAGWPKERRIARARELLVRVGLGDRLHHRPSELSGGQCQRLAIARALARDPHLILADEPTGNLDTHTGREILALFEELHEAGRTIVLVTHDERVAGRAERQIRMVDGRVVGTGVDYS